MRDRVGVWGFERFPLKFQSMHISKFFLLVQPNKLVAKSQHAYLEFRGGVGRSPAFLNKPIIQ